MCHKVVYDQNQHRGEQKATDYVEKYGLKISAVLYSFVKDRALDGTGIALEVFWEGLSDLITDLAPVNRMILDKRSDIQAKLTLGI